MPLFTGDIKANSFSLSLISANNVVLSRRISNTLFNIVKILIRGCTKGLTCGRIKGDNRLL